jgi:Cu(I)/Ag(I) efflux system outer membrane protein
VTGSTNVLALEQARGQIESTRAEIAKREGDLAQANNALQLVLGTYRALPSEKGMKGGEIAPVKLPPNLFTNFAAATGYYGSGISAESG